MTEAIFDWIFFFDMRRNT